MSEQANTACVSRRTPTTLPMTSLHLSRFNARTQRATQHITTLAERIQRNGFEPTRALWVYPVNGHYEVFAGGTRLAAAREAGLSEVPVVLYEGYDDTAISRLADEDNENDEYHVPVPLPDVWAEYRRLKDEEGWTHERISQAKGVNRATVTLRMGYAEFPEKVLAAFVKNDFLKESHASEMSKLLDFNNLTPWLTRDQALTEILASMLEKHRGGSTGLAPTASVFASAVKTWNVMLTAAADAIAGFPQRVEDGSTIFVPHEAFLAALATRTVRTAKDVVMVAGQITGQLQAIERRRLAMIEAEHRRLTAEQEAAEREADRLATERHRKAYIESRLSWLHHGDCRTLIPTHCPGDIRLVLTDPPYGKQFQSNRRVTTKKKSVMPGDASPEEAACLLAEMLAVMTPKLLPDAHLLVFTHQDSYETFCGVIRKAGLTLRRTMTWLKGNHGMGDVTGAESLSETEWVIHAVQGNPKFTEGIDRSELLDFPGTQDSAHPTEKPLTLLRHLILRASHPGDVVADPFVGTANTLLAALCEDRQGWACEIDRTYYREGADKLYSALLGEGEAL